MLGVLPGNEGTGKYYPTSLTFVENCALVV
jgi:hypothetical protein